MCCASTIGATVRTADLVTRLRSECSHAIASLDMAVNNLQAQGRASDIAPLSYDPIVQWPRTPPFHGGNTGSNPVRVATANRDVSVRRPASER